MQSIKPKLCEHSVVYRVTKSIFGYQGWPSVTIDENGTLYAAASAFRCEHVDPCGKTAMFVSKTAGKTWTPPIVVNDTFLDDRDAGILYQGDGRMLVTWFSHSAKSYLSDYFTGIKNSSQRREIGVEMGLINSYQFLPEAECEGGSYVRVSEDGGVIWSDPIRIPVSAPHGPNLCADGTLLYLGKEFLAPEGTEEKEVIAAYASEDHGYTWERRGICEKPEALSWDHFHEPHVLALPDGTLLGAIRAQGEGIPHGFSVYVTKSTDGGYTWSRWRCLGVSGSPPHLMYHSSGAVICTIGRREPPFGEYALISRDNGETWEEEYCIDDRAQDGDLGYPASVELPDGSIVTVYYQKYYDAAREKYDSKPSILCTHWALND